MGVGAGAALLVGVGAALLVGVGAALLVGVGAALLMGLGMGMRVQAELPLLLKKQPVHEMGEVVWMPEVPRPNLVAVD